MDIHYERLNLGGKVGLVTGGTGGIGREIALELARRGMDVLIVGRNVERGEAVAKQAAIEGGKIEFIRADLAEMAQVREVATIMLEQRERLDLLVHSAGTHHLEKTLTPDGVEYNFAANYLCRFLLSELLLERLHASGPARIVLLGAPYKFNPKKFLVVGERFTQKERLPYPLWALALSGMAISVLTAALARRLEGSLVSVVNVAPGFVKTGILDSYPWLFRAFDDVLQRFSGMTAQEGAQAPLYFATAKEAGGLNGQFFVKMEPVKIPPGTFDHTLARRLWAFSERLTGLEPQEFEDPGQIGTGKLVLLTGGSRGLGFEAALKLAGLGYRVTLTARTLERAEAAAKRIRSSVPGARVRGLALDLTDLKGVRDFAQRFSSEEKSLDALIANAAHLPAQTLERSAQGLEKTFTANHLGHFLLVRELKFTLEAAAHLQGEARVIVVSSRLHKPGTLLPPGPQTRLDLQDVNLERGYSSMRAYKNSKLANLLFTYELNRRLKGTGVTANALCPSFVPETGFELTRGPGRAFTRYLAPLLPFAKSLNEATDTYLYLASDPQLKGVGGRFYGEGREIPSSAESYSLSKAVQLWTLSERLCDAALGDDVTLGGEESGLTPDSSAAKVPELAQ